MTLIFAGLLMAAGIPADLLSRADAAGLAYVQCLYGTVRHANERGLSPGEFERKLSASCLEEERAHRALATSIFTLQGHSGAAAEAAGLDRETRRQILSDYTRLPEIQRNLEQLARICQANPSACHE
jgi:hypothetical protein